MQYNFEWNPAKNLLNVRKHGISFELSASVFSDPLAITVFDGEHSDSEDRWITIGISQTGVLLVAHHTYEIITDKQVRIRIFSSRKASQNEQQQYKGI